MGWFRRQWWYLTLPRHAPELPDLPPDERSPEEREEVRQLLRRFDTADEATRARIWAKLPRGPRVFPYFLEAYPHARRMEARHSMMFEATFFARMNEEAFRLGLLGVADRSKFVRDRACGVLAYSLRPDVLSALRPLLRDPDPHLREFAEGAVDAIKSKDHHRYYGGRPDQTHWVVNKGDAPDLPDVGRDIEAEL